MARKFKERVRSVVLTSEAATIYAGVLRDLGIKYTAWFSNDPGTKLWMLAFRCDLPTLNMIETFVDVDETICKFQKGVI